GHQQHLLQRRIANLVAPALADLTWHPKPGEDDLTGKLRGLLIVLLACDAGDPDAQQTARTFFAAAEAGQDVHPEVAAAATTVVASTGGETEFNRFVDKFKTADSPQDQMRALYALADFQSADLIERACEFAFSGEVKTQNAPFLLNRLIANREFGPVAWRVVRQRWTEANEKFPVNTIVRMIDIPATVEVGRTTTSSTKGGSAIPMPIPTSPVGSCSRFSSSSEPGRSPDASGTGPSARPSECCRSW
ncbi:MAG: ERAP1-like C-terminal domain-containing protein, partial [Actinomycetota bacterium]